MIISLLGFMTVAFAGYGDASDGYPNYSERLLHHWTNAVRVDPEAFKDSYVDGGCRWKQFSADEQTAKAPLMWNHGLNEAARVHTEDMESHDELRHESADGTSFFDRTSQYYSGSYYGENVAWGYGNEFEAVVLGWMCSTTGHRANMMAGDFNELGTGVVDVYYTQDFGARDLAYRQISMGIHTPKVPSTGVTFSADFYDESGRSPDRFDVVMNGMSYPLELILGESSRGMWSVEVEVDEEAEVCHSYIFLAEVDGERELFPENGSYGFGACEFDSSSGQWLDRQEIQGCGCNVGGIPAALALWPLALVGLRRRQLS